MNDEQVSYRLDNIEKVLSELKDVVLENKMQARDIADLNTKVNEFLGAVNAHEARIRSLETAPLKGKADKWQSIVDTFSKLAMTAIAGMILAKIGLA